MNNETFDGILTKLISEMTAEQLLTYPGVYEIFAEALNNEVLDIGAQQERSGQEYQPKLPKPQDDAVRFVFVAMMKYAKIDIDRRAGCSIDDNDWEEAYTASQRAKAEFEKRWDW